MRWLNTDAYASCLPSILGRPELQPMIKATAFEFTPSSKVGIKHLDPFPCPRKEILLNKSFNDFVGLGHTSIDPTPFGEVLCEVGLESFLSTWQISLWIDHIKCGVGVELRNIELL
uniref:Uncharacterized protein n=1 Tax=Rodentolepis nana TaxID=102285 RepID=A0A0R3T584_RODNA